MLYYGAGLDGVFDRTPMYDDGMHGDQAAGDNIYGALIPAYQSGSYVPLSFSFGDTEIQELRLFLSAIYRF